MKPHYPGDEYIETRWAIRWTSPPEIADTIVIIASYEDASRYLALSLGNTGEVVYQRVVYSPWSNH